MFVFDPGPVFSGIFVVLVVLVVLADLWMVGRAAPEGAKTRWLKRGGALALFWLAGHALIAESGVLEKEMVPPPAMLYLLLTNIVAAVVAFSSVGKHLARLPLVLLVGLQAFRFPLEWFLHALYDDGSLPVQMTWSGANFDVLTGASAVVLAILLWKRRAPRWLVWLWNVMGLVLLLNIMVIAVLSVPTPFKSFDGPPLVLALHVPYNWIVNVHVWTALVGHLVIFRALMLKRGHAPT